MTKTSDLVCRAKELAQAATSWADLSNALFDPLEGLLARAFPTREERQQFVRTSEYQLIQQVLADAVQRFGLVEGATPTKITEFMVQLHLTSEDQITSGTTFRTANDSEISSHPSSQTAR